MGHDDVGHPVVGIEQGIERVRLGAQEDQCGVDPAVDEAVVDESELAEDEVTYFSTAFIEIFSTSATARFDSPWAICSRTSASRGEFGSRAGGTA